MEIVWQALEWPGMEHVTWENGHADSVALIVYPDGPHRIRYRISPTEVTVNDLVLEHDGKGRWRGRPELDGCLEVDISITPLTNTLPINRLRLGVGESAEIRVAYIDVPQFAVSVMPQRYTRLEERLYRFQSDGFQADLTVDEQGIIVDYPGLWRRVA